MKYCTRCLYPANHPLRLTFDDEGVCSGCRVHEEKDRLDWTARFEKLRSLVDGYRSKQRTVHDCIVPVSGARDSYFIVHVVKERLGLRPLLVSYNKHYNTQVGIRNLATLRTLAGCDIMTSTASPEKVRRVTRETLRLRGSMYWHCLAGETAFPVQVAVKFKIPLIIWGAQQGVDQVGMFSHEDEVEMTRKYRQEHDLMDLDEQALLAQAPALDESDIEPFRYPHDKELEAIGVRGVYLNNYVRWDSKAQHEAMIERWGYETAAQRRTFDTYNDVDSFHYSGLHDWIKFAKWGYGKATDHASREIRLRRMTREQGIEMVRRYESVPPGDMPLFLEWLGMSESELLSHVDRFRDPRIWRGNELLDSVTRQARPDAGTGSCDFRLTPSKAPGVPDDRYVLIGRGWVDGPTTAS